MSGLRCYLHVSSSRWQGEHKIRLYEGVEELCAHMLKVYMLLIKQNDIMRSSVFERSEKMKELVLELLSFTNYENYLFDQAPEGFLDLLRDLC